MVTDLTKRPLTLVHPCVPSQKTQIMSADRQRISTAGQPLDDVRRQVGHVSITRGSNTVEYQTRPRAERLVPIRKQRRRFRPGRRRIPDGRE